MARRALISGASIAGLATAYWLGRIGWEVRVVERADAFRTGGQNVDIRGVARDVVERMGLTDAVRDRSTGERGTRFVDDEGLTVAEFAQSGHDDGPTAELEILRGDLAALLRDAAGDLDIRYGTTIETAAPTASGVEVLTNDGERAEVDLVIVAEGVRSATRDAIFGDAVTRTPLELAMVYGTIERAASDDDWWNWYTATGSRQVTTRPDPVGTTRATLAYVSEDDELTGLDPADRDDVLRRRFADAGWEAERVVEGFARSDDVYVDYLTQIAVDRWSAGRVVLIGDAAWCVTPLGGGGCSLALTGGYVLAAMLSQQPDDVDGALGAFEAWLRPLTDAAQKLPPGMPRMAYPASRIGVGMQRVLARIAGSRPLRDVVARKMGDVVTDDRQLPALHAS